VRLCQRHNRGIPEDQPDSSKKVMPPPRKTLKIAIALFVVDAFFLNQGIFSGVFLAVLLLGFCRLLSIRRCANAGRSSGAE
jgi:hypothetical protein